MADITQIAIRTKTDPYFLGYHIHAYAVAHDLDAEGMAARLSCPLDRLEYLMLCRKPVTMADVERVADCVPCDAGALAAIMFLGLN